MAKLSTRSGIVLAAGIIVFTGGNPTWARGGGGGFGGFRGAGGFDRGFSDFDRGGIERAELPANGAAGRDNQDAFTRTPVNEDALRAGADHTYNYADANSLATDGGFGRISTVNVFGGTGNRTNYVSSATFAGRGDAVRAAYRDHGLFDNGWWASHPNAWRYADSRYDWCWGYTGWPVLGGWWGVSDTPVVYDYGNTITYQNDNVYYGTQPIGSATAYYSQAQALAETKDTSSNKSKKSSGEWKPLGVFSLAQAGQTDTTSVFQLAVNKSGIIRGNYDNLLTNEVQPVHGAVDKKSMRAAWTVGNDKKVVYDTGLANLLEKQSSILVHFDKDQTKQWSMIRLPQPTVASNPDGK